MSAVAAGMAQGSKTVDVHAVAVYGKPGSQPLQLRLLGIVYLSLLIEH